MHNRSPHAAALPNVPPTRHRSRVCLQAAGRETTGGIFDERMYRYAISPEAQETHHVEECYQVLPPIRSN